VLAADLNRTSTEGMCLLTGGPSLTLTK
jgi:hypothetical protein